MTDRLFAAEDMDREVPQPTNVIPIGRARVRKPPEPHAGTVELLERVLDLARKGEVVGVAIASAYASGHTGTGHAHRRGSWELLLAAVHRLRLRVDDYERSTD